MRFFFSCSNDDVLQIVNMGLSCIEGVISRPRVFFLSLLWQNQKKNLHPGDQVLKHFIRVMDNVSLKQAVLKCSTEQVARDSRASHFSFSIIVKP